MPDPIPALNPALDARLEAGWNQRHQAAAPWDSGRHCAELERVLEAHAIAPCRALELGCGHGRDAVFLAQRGFEVTAADVSGEALGRAQAAAREAQVAPRFVHADVLQLPDLGAPFAFVFDRGFYQHGRLQRAAFENLLGRVTAPGSRYLAIMPSANDREVRAPRALRENDLRAELAHLFNLVELREIRFAPAMFKGRELRPLMWSALFQRK